MYGTHLSEEKFQLMYLWRTYIIKWKQIFVFFGKPSGISISPRTDNVKKSEIELCSVFHGP